jgi:hypothetical protein
MDYDIPLGKPVAKDKFGYKTPEFEADGSVHDLGFVINRNGYLASIGTKGGGWDGANFEVNSKGVIISDPDRQFEYKCERFLKNFDDFEKRFYEYVDSL